MNEPKTNLPLSAAIVARLESAHAEAASQFSEPNEVGVRCCFIDDLLPDDVAHRIYECFPRPDQMRLLNSFRERKYTSKDLDAFALC